MTNLLIDLLLTPNARLAVFDNSCRTWINAVVYTAECPVTFVGSAGVCQAEPGAVSVRSLFLSAHHGLPDENLPTFAVFTLAVAKNLI